MMDLVCRQGILNFFLPPLKGGRVLLLKRVDGGERHPLNLEFFQFQGCVRILGGGSE